jgi:hypothetical protein
MVSNKLISWVSSSSVRVYPATRPGRSGLPRLDAALNEQFSFQVAVHNRSPQPQKVRLEAVGPDDWQVRVRVVGYVPMRHHNTPIEKSSLDCEGRGHVPGFVPDPLFDTDSILVPPAETHAFWITVRPGNGARPGRYSIKLCVRPEEEKRMSHTVSVRLHDVALEHRKNFAVTHWFYADALIDWYKTDLFDRRFWEILPRYVRNMADHGQDTLYVPVFTPPLDGVKRPSQLLHVTRAGRHKYRFDWRDVRQYVDLARRCGIRNLEWCHPFTQWGVKHAIRIYEEQGRDEKLLWPPETGATSPAYRRFLSQFLPELRRFLQRESLLDRSFFHVSDEPHGEEHMANYARARALLRELAPWMKVMDALSQIEFARRQLTDMPVPSISKALDFVAEGIPCWCYYCCGPRGRFLNRLMDTPLAKIAMHGFLFYRRPFKGFLHWGYNYWYESQTRKLIDPCSVQDGLRWPGWAYGDPFVVYPGENGPVDSVRWEIFGESLQDYRLLQTLGVERHDPLLRPLRNFEDFPKTESWRRSTRAKLLRGGAERRK